MKIVGIIAEYNPFHKGHVYHLEKIKEMYPDSVVIAVVSSLFTQRGEVSVLNKQEKTKIALDNGIDLVVELPFVYATQSADKFAYAALKLLNELHVEKIVFGSESNDLNNLKEIAEIQINNDDFDSKVRNYLSLGNNYPTSLSLALKSFNLNKIDSPNDLLGISYIKEIVKNNYDIEPVSIKRTNNFHGNNKGTVLSASEIRDKLKNNEDISDYISYREELLYKGIDFFRLLKYEIVKSNNLKDILDIEEGIDVRINKYINESNCIDDLVKKVKTKRYTYNKVNRMFIHILTNLKKEEANLEIDYIRVLGFNKNGKSYLNKIKKDINIPIITKYKDINSPLLDIEKRACLIYSLIVDDNNIVKNEFNKPIYDE